MDNKRNRVLCLAGAALLIGSQAFAMPWSKKRMETPETRHYKQEIAKFKSHKADLQAKRGEINDEIDAVAAMIDRLQDRIEACHRAYDAEEDHLVAEARRKSTRLGGVNYVDMTVGTRARQTTKEQIKTKAGNRVLYRERESIAERQVNPYLEEEGVLR